MIVSKEHCTQINGDVKGTCIFSPHSFLRYALYLSSEQEQTLFKDLRLI